MYCQTKVHIYLILDNIDLPPVPLMGISWKYHLRWKNNRVSIPHTSILAMALCPIHRYNKIKYGAQTMIRLQDYICVHVYLKPIICWNNYVSIYTYTQNILTWLKFLFSKQKHRSMFILTAVQKKPPTEVLAQPQGWRHT